MPENKHLRFFVILLYLALGLLAFWFLLRYALGWVAPFLIAFLLSRLIARPVRFMNTRLHLPRPLASGIWTILAFGAVGAGVYWVIARIVREIRALIADLPDAGTIITQVTDFLNRLSVNFLDTIPADIRATIELALESMVDEALTLPKQLLSSVGSYTASAAGSLPSILLFIIAVLVSTYFFSSDDPNIRAWIAAHMSKKWKNGYLQTRAHFFKTMVSYVCAMAILLCLTFVELAIGFAILGLDYALVLAFFISLIDALPILGTGTVLIPWALVSLITGDFFIAIGLAVIYGVVAIVRNLIEPKIIGQQIGLHPLITLASVYVGLKIFGFFGIFMPVFLVFAKQLYAWGYLDFLHDGRKSAL